MWRTLVLTAAVSLTSLNALAVDTDTASGNPPPINGYYLAHADKTGFARAIVRIDRLPDATYSGTVAKILPRPGYTPRIICTGCAGRYNNQPITGMNVFQHVVRSHEKPTLYEGGKVLDPVSGRQYNALITSSKNGDTIKVRGYLGVPLMGRTAYWMKTNDPERYLKAADPIKGR